MSNNINKFKPTKEMLKEDALVVYHGGCLDGAGSAWAFRYHAVLLNQFFNSVHFVEGFYGTSLNDFEDKHVFLVDFTYPRGDLIMIASQAKSLTIIDHHAGALEDTTLAQEICKDINSKTPFIYIFDNNKSGALLTWEFFTEEEAPVFIRNISDRDLWKFEMLSTEEVCSALYLDLKHWKAWTCYMGKAAYDTLVTNGALLVEYRNNSIDLIIKTKQHFALGLMLWDVNVVNCPYQYASEIGDRMNLAEPQIASLSYYIDHTTGLAHCSVRTHNDNPITALTIAKHFKGGGHKHAAGFKIEAQDLFKSLLKVKSYSSFPSNK